MGGRGVAGELLADGDPSLLPSLTASRACPALCREPTLTRAATGSAGAATPPALPASCPGGVTAHELAVIFGVSLAAGIQNCRADTGSPVGRNHVPSGLPSILVALDPTSSTKECQPSDSPLDAEEPSRTAVRGESASSSSSPFPPLPLPVVIVTAAALCADAAVASAMASTVSAGDVGLNSVTTADGVRDSLEDDASLMPSTSTSASSTFRPGTLCPPSCSALPVVPGVVDVLSHVREASPKPRSKTTTSWLGSNENLGAVDSLGE